MVLPMAIPMIVFFLIRDGPARVLDVEGSGEVGAMGTEEFELDGVVEGVVIVLAFF